MKHSLILAAALALAACQTTTTTVTTTTAPTEPVPCQAANFQTLVGQPKSAIRAAGIPGIVRVITPDTAVTLDYNADRLNIQLDAKGIIQKVTCG